MSPVIFVKPLSYIPSPSRRKLELYGAPAGAPSMPKADQEELLGRQRAGDTVE